MEVGAALEARRLVGVGVEGGGGRFFDEAEAVGGEDDNEEMCGRFEVDAEVRLGRDLAVADTFDGEGFAIEVEDEDGMIRVVGELVAVDDAGVTELYRLRPVMVPVSVLPATVVAPVSREVGGLGGWVRASFPFSVLARIDDRLRMVGGATAAAAPVALF